MMVQNTNDKGFTMAIANYPNKNQFAETYALDNVLNHGQISYRQTITKVTNSTFPKY